MPQHAGKHSSMSAETRMQQTKLPRSCRNTATHACRHTLMHAHTHIHTYTHTHTQMYVVTHTDVCSHTHTDVYTHTHTHTRTRTHTIPSLVCGAGRDFTSVITMGRSQPRLECLTFRTVSWSVSECWEPFPCQSIVLPVGL